MQYIEKYEIHNWCKVMSELFGTSEEMLSLSPAKDTRKFREFSAIIYTSTLIGIDISWGLD